MRLDAGFLLCRSANRITFLLLILVMLFISETFAQTYSTSNQDCVNLNDPTGDATPSYIDILGASACMDGGNIVAKFKLAQLPSQARPGDVTAYYVLIDTDMNSQTGEPDEYIGPEVMISGAYFMGAWKPLDSIGTVARWNEATQRWESTGVAVAISEDPSTNTVTFTAPLSGISLSSSCVSFRAELSYGDSDSTVAVCGNVPPSPSNEYDFSKGVDPFFTVIKQGGSADVTPNGLSISSGQNIASFVRTTNPLPETYTIEAVIENKQQYQVAVFDDAWPGQAGDWNMNGPHLKAIFWIDNFGPAGNRNAIFYASPISYTAGSMNWVGAWDGTAWRSPGTATLSPQMNVGGLYRLGIQKTKDEYTLYIKTLGDETLTKASVPIDQVNNGRSQDFWMFGDASTDCWYGVNTRIVSATVKEVSTGDTSPESPDQTHSITESMQWTKGPTPPIVSQEEKYLSEPGTINTVSATYDSCISSGGTVVTRMCCMSAPDFPNTCVIGPCGCSPENSKETKVCDCGAGRCFDGTACVAI